MQKGVFWIGKRVECRLKKFRDQQQSGYLGVFVEMDFGSPGSVKGVGICQGVLGVYGV